MNRPHDLGCQCWPHYSAADFSAFREAIAQLAEHHNVRIDLGPLSDPPVIPFADLIRARADNEYSVKLESE